MKYEDIIKLLDNGYSREDILKMDQESVDSEETTTNDSEDLNSVNEIGKALQEVRDSINDFKKEITAMNIMNSSIEGDSKERPEDIIANIINPELKDNKED